MDRTYPLNPLRGRDDNGPIFLISDVDPRLPVHEVVLGVTAPDGLLVCLEPVQPRNRLVESWAVMCQSMKRCKAQ